MIVWDAMARLNSTHYRPGEFYCLEIRMREGHPCTSLWNRVSNLSVSFQRLNGLDNSIGFGVGKRPDVYDGILFIRGAIPPDAKYGLYYSCSANLLDENGVDGQQLNISFPAVFFTIQSVLQAPASSDQLKSIVQGALTCREQQVMAPIITDQAKLCLEGHKQFKIIIYATGCLLPTMQLSKGFHIEPLDGGLSYVQYLQVVNTHLAKQENLEIPFSGTIEHEFGVNTPCFALTYNVVDATDHDDAFAHCQNHANLVFELLGWLREQMPQTFSRIAINLNTNECFHQFLSPTYRGNLAVGWVESIANTFDRLIPKLQNNPFLRLVVKTYASATSEKDPGFALLRYWAVLELLADKHVAKGKPLLYPDQKPIVGAKNKRKTTDHKEGRVYEYLSSYLHPSPEIVGLTDKEGRRRKYVLGGQVSKTDFDSEKINITLWDMVSATYAIRNAVAHEGMFDISRVDDVSKFYEKMAKIFIAYGGELHPLCFVRRQAMFAILTKLSEV